MLEIGKKIEHQHHMLANSKTANQVADILNVLKKLNFDQQQFKVSLTPAGYFITLKSTTQSENINNFHCYDIVNNTVDVGSGNFILAGIGNYRFEPNNDGLAGTITLSGSPDWIFAYLQRDGTSYGIDHMSTYPLSDTNTIRLPLAKYDLDNDGNYFQVEICHEYDLYVDMPIR